MRKIVSAFLLLLLLPMLSTAQNVKAGAPTQLPGLIQAGEVIRDSNGIPHISASNDHDLMFLQGYVHAQDRLFEMDYYRRIGSGTTAEIFGPAPSAIASDVKMRTLGLRRGAGLSWPMLSPRMQAMLQAYADGVNAYATKNPLPLEYAALGIRFEPWTPLDSLTIDRVLGASLALDDFDATNTITLMTYILAGQALKIDGQALFFEDLFRSAPFDPAATVLDASMTAATTKTAREAGKAFQPNVKKETLDLIKRYVRETDGLPALRQFKHGHGGASNVWAIRGALSATGVPLLANDPHLDLTYPSIFYPMQLRAGAIDEVGNSVPGAPLLLLGQNRFVSWGLTTEYADVTDWYQENVTFDMTSPSMLSSTYQGKPEWIIPIPEVYRANVGGHLVTLGAADGVPPATLIVPRHGPIVDINLAKGVAITVQWTGFKGSREFDAMLAWAEAKNLTDFQVGVNLFDCPPQNVGYSDVAGNIAFFSAGEIPIREDLQAMSIHGLPPNLLRDGTGGNEWLPVKHLQPLQTMPYEIIPAAEMPHVINPPAGYFVNANNDGAGTTLDNSPFTKLRPGGGIFYITYEYNPGYRAGRIEELLSQKLAAGKVSADDMQKMQADTVLRDAEFFVPYITQAFDNAKRNGAPLALAGFLNNAAVVEAVGRLRAWDFTTPTGIPEGYDAFDTPGQTNSRTPAEIADSVAATIYSVWRGQAIRGVIFSKLEPFGLPTPPEFGSMKAMRNLLENFGTNMGVGASGIDFFALSGVTNAADRRDIYLLQALADSLNLLKGSAFDKAFHKSANQDDYRWGKLHRITFDHPLGAPFSVPPAADYFQSPLAGLPGIPTDGGYQTVDEADHDLFAADDSSFTWIHGPAQRYVSEGLKSGMHGMNSLPGGISGEFGPLYTNLLPQWLVNGSYEMLFGKNELNGQTSSVTKYVLGK
jgi:penicillin amidase